MKIAPIAAPTPANVQNQTSGAQEPRRISMRVNQTPETYRPESFFQSQGGQESAISDAGNGQAPEANEETKPLSPQYAALAKQKRALQVKERELQAREQQFKDQSAGNAAGIDLARLKAEPLRVLLESGVTYEQLTQEIMSNPSGYKPELQALRDELKALKEEVPKRFSEADERQEQQALAAMGREAESLVSQGDEFELVRETRSVPKVIDLIRRTYKATGEVLDVHEATSLVEQELFKDYSRLANLGKLRSQFQEHRAAPSQQSQFDRPQMRTLTSRDNAQPPMSAKQRALAAFYGQLRK